MSYTPPPPPPPPPGGGFPPPPPPSYGAPMGGGPVGGFQYAEWPQRALSGLIDYFGILILAIIVQVTVSAALGGLLSLAAIGWGLFNGYQQGETGQSIGKKQAGLKLVSEETGQPIGGTNGIVRAIAHFIDGIICYIGFLFPLWDSKKQTIADKIMKTVVVKA